MIEEQKIFIECYSFKQMKFKEIVIELKKFDSSKKYSDVQRLYEECKEKRTEVQKIRKKFTKERQKDNKDFKTFYDWYREEKTKNICDYCAISQEELKLIFPLKIPLNYELKIKSGDSPKRASGTLEIERKDSENNSYHVDNLILACPLCNNAKSNLIDEKSWRELFVQPMRNYYEKLLKRPLKFSIPLSK